MTEHVVGTGNGSAGADAGAEDYEDGNVLAGPLREIFTVDVTTAVGRCVSCGLVGPVATLRVYSRGPGLVGRCPGCDGVVLRFVRGPDSAWLDLTGTTSLRIALDPS